MALEKRIAGLYGRVGLLRRVVCVRELTGGVREIRRDLRRLGERLDRPGVVAAREPRLAQMQPRVDLGRQQRGSLLQCLLGFIVTLELIQRDTFDQ